MPPVGWSSVGVKSDDYIHKLERTLKHELISIAYETPTD